MATEPQQRGALGPGPELSGKPGDPFPNQLVTDHLLLLASVTVTFSDRQNIPAGLFSF